jgi:predicted small lipoprotein YifL
MCPTLMKPIQILLFCLLGTCLASGCGQKGSLYLPRPEPAAMPGSEPVTQAETGTDEAESGNGDEDEDS